jgi:hypothetical protein
MPGAGAYQNSFKTFMTFFFFFFLIVFERNEKVIWLGLFFIDRSSNYSQELGGNKQKTTLRP